MPQNIVLSKHVDKLETIEWQTVRLGDVAIVKSGYAFKSDDWLDYGVPVIKITNVKDGRIVLEGCSYVSSDVAKKAKYFQLQRGDILIAMTGYVGDVAMVRNEPEMVLNQRVGKFFIQKPDRLDSQFLFYFLRNPVTKLKVENLGYGSAQANVSPTLIQDMELPLPSLAEQHSIASILGSLDDKIELNRQMNAALEQTARALFKSWFVDFDPVRAKAEGRDTGLPKEMADLFPNSFEDSELGEVPRGWEVASFTKNVEIIGGGTPKTAMSIYWDGEIPWFSVADAPSESDIFVIDTIKKITPEGIENSSTSILPVGTTIITARGTVGKVALVGKPMAMNQSCYGLRGQNNYYVYFSTLALVSKVQQRAHGSVFDTITRDTLAGVRVVVPDQIAIDAFEASIEPLLKRIESNLFESQNLEKIRDALLPELLSGSVKINYAAS